jgi:hypothetical protein
MKALGALIKAIGELVLVGAAVWLCIFFPWFADDGITGKRAITATIVVVVIVAIAMLRGGFFKSPRARR